MTLTALAATPLIGAFVVALMPRGVERAVKSTAVAFSLAALSPLVTIGGSLVIALALAEGAIEADAAFDAAHLDEIWQAERWGEDSLATQARDARRRDFNAATDFLRLL